MSIAQEIVRLEAAVDDLSRCVHSLDEEFFLARLAGWSPRDIVAHLVGWNRSVIRGCAQIQRGELPFYDVDPGEDYSKVNAELVASYPSADRSEMLAELRTSADELRIYLRSVDPGVWSRDFGVRHDGETVVIEGTIGELIDDYGHHRKQIEEWVRALK